MAKISLRAYNKEIESLIDRGTNDEAITQCKYILQSFPKCIVTYRNLAKALLESKRYAEAEDIFSRVLSVYPDDFVSHIGISIIKENEADLDAAIWHMELAYDVQPSNPALTGELRRLFGRRDGVQPPKIRLTRGALIRMYARGVLYQQAIAEIQSALAADPMRIDLEVILADMYYQSGSLLDASETCSALLSQIPYCFEANHLLLQIIPKTTLAQSAREYKDRLAELDPYFGFITSPDMTGDDIPEDQILLDYLDKEPANESQEDQGWTKSVGIEWEKESEIQKLYWIEEKNNQEATLDPETGVTNALDKKGETSDFMTHSLSIDSENSSEPPTQASEEFIPDWMRSAGWGPSTNSEQNELDNSITSIENISNEDVEIQPADLPDWLSSAAPATVPLGDLENEPDSMADEDSTSFDTSLPEQISGESVLPLVDPSNAGTNASSSDWAPEPLSENSKPEQGETGGKMPTDSSNNENEWLNQFRNDSPNKGEESDLPDWLKDFESEKDQPLEENMDIPEWLKSLEPMEPSIDEPASENPVPSGLKDEVFPSSTKEEAESAITGTSFLFTKALTEDEVRSGKLDATTLPPEEHALPSDWESALEKTTGEVPENVAPSSLEEEVLPVPEETIEPAVTSTSYMFTKTLTEEEVRSGKLDASVLTPDAHSLPSDWESSLENAPEPAAAQPAKEVHAELPAWVKNVLKQAPPATTPSSEEVAIPAQTSETETTPAPVMSGPVEPVKSSILDQLTAPVESVPAVEQPEPAGEAAIESASEPESAEVEKLKALEAFGEEPIQDLASGPQTEGAISEDTNAELLDWLRGFNSSEENPQESQPVSEETPSEVEIPAETGEESPLDRLDDFVQPEETEIIPAETPAAAADELEQIPEPVPAYAENIEPAAPSMESIEPEPPVEESFAPEEEAAISDEIPSMPEPLPLTEEPPAVEAESQMAEPSVEPVEAQAEAPVVPEEVAQVSEPIETAVSVEGVSEPVETPIAEEMVAETVKTPISEEVTPVPPVVTDPLLLAGSALDTGDLTLALNEYTMALQDESNLPSLIEALKSATDKHENETDLWQLLGDAHARTNNYAEAFSAYDKAESLLLDLIK